MPEALALVLALLVLAGTLAAAVVHSRWPVEALAAAGGAALLVAVGALSASDARDAIGDLGPTVGFLAALLVLAEGCRREGLFDAMGGLMAAGARAAARGACSPWSSPSRRRSPPCSAWTRPSCC